MKPTCSYVFNNEFQLFSHVAGFFPVTSTMYCFKLNLPYPHVLMSRSAPNLKLEVVLDGRPVAFFERHCDDGWDCRNHPQVATLFNL